MGKRLFRLSGQEALHHQAELIGGEINIVLRNNKVFFGVLKNLEGTLFVCENKLGKKFQIPCDDIKEIIYDTHSSY